MASEQALSAPAAPAEPSLLNMSQVADACRVLLRHMAGEREQTQPGKQSLLDGDDVASGQAVWLIATTKKHIVDQKRLKPSKITLPHSLNTQPSGSICLITADPQATYTELVASPAFPAHLRQRIAKIISLSQLRKNHSSFESRRALFATYDVFLADDRIVTYLPGLLGKVFYKGGVKRPIPVNFAAARERGDDGKRVKIDPASGKKQKQTEEKEARGAATPAAAAREVERALTSALVHLAPGTSTTVKVAHAGMPAEQVVANIAAVVAGLVDRFIAHGWRNVRALHIKGPNTASFPVFLADELWVDEGDVLDEAKAFGKAKQAKEAKAIEPESIEAVADDASPPSKRKAADTPKPSAAKHAKKKRRVDVEAEAALAANAAARKQELAAHKAELRAALV